MTASDIRERNARGIAVLGEAGFKRLQGSRVIVFGIGGVGAACAEALVRSGVGCLALVDPDKVEKSNLNRQLIALHSTLGQQKTSVCSARMKDISPEVEVVEYPLFYDEQSASQIDLAQFDAVADCIDTISSKLLLAKRAQQAGIYAVSCLGAGNRLDATKLQFADIYQTSVCPLARRMRKACREQGIPALRVLYSLEEPVQAVADCQAGRHSPGSTAFVPPAAGLMMAGDIVQHLISRL